MTTRRLTKRRAVLERHKSEVLALVVEGRGDPEIAAKYGCRRESVYLFRERYKDLLLGMRGEVERQVEAAAIAHVVNRVFDADADYNRLGEVIDARAGDPRYTEPGYRSGLMVHEVKAIGAGENFAVVDQYKVDTALIAERRALRRAVAEELGQLPRAEVNVDARTQILIRQVEGFDVDKLG